LAKFALISVPNPLPGLAPLLGDNSMLYYPGPGARPFFPIEEPVLMPKEYAMFFSTILLAL